MTIIITKTFRLSYHWAAVILSMMDYMCWQVDYASIVHIPHEYRLVLTSHLAVGKWVAYEKLLHTLDRLWQPNHNKSSSKKFKKIYTLIGLL